MTVGGADGGAESTGSGAGSMGTGARASSAEGVFPPRPERGRDKKKWHEALEAGPPSLPKKNNKPKETTRQKNKRKEALGQAKFTVKAERECPDIWQGP